MAPPDQAHREQLMALLDGLGAHMPFEEAIADFPGEAINASRPTSRTRHGT
jgi:hypothetical protein